MGSSPATTDIAKVLELFGHSADGASLDPLWNEMRDIEESARREMRKRLRPDEFAEVAALAEACAAAQNILTRLRANG